VMSACAVVAAMTPARSAAKLKVLRIVFPFVENSRDVSETLSWTKSDQEFSVGNQQNRAEA
jgi:hypothetical protein